MALKSCVIVGAGLVVLGEFAIAKTARQQTIKKDAMTAAPIFRNFPGNFF